LVFTSFPIVSQLSIVPGMSDHEAVSFSVNVKADRTQNIAKHTVFLYHKGNIQKRHVRFCDTFMSPDPFTRTVEENWQLFKTCIQDSIIQHVPQKKQLKLRIAYLGLIMILNIV